MQFLVIFIFLFFLLRDQRKFRQARPVVHGSDDGQTASVLSKRKEAERMAKRSGINE